MNINLILSLFFLSWLTLLLPLGFLTKNIFLQPREISWLFIALLYSFLCDLLSTVFWQVGILPNYAGHAYPTLGFLLNSLFFFYAIAWTRIKTILIVVNFIFLFVVLNFIPQYGTTSYLSYIGTPHSILIITMSIIFFYKLLKELPAQQLQNMPMFWIVSGLFFSFSGKLVVFIVMNYLVTYIKDNLAIVFSIHNCLTIIANLIIAYGTWLHYKEITRSESPL